MLAIVKYWVLYWVLSCLLFIIMILIFLHSILVNSITIKIIAGIFLMVSCFNMIFAEDILLDYYAIQHEDKKVYK